MKDIILTGPKHSGKTSTGMALASLCSCEFIDLDDLIAQQSGKSARQLYTEGKEVFQKAEVEAVEFLANDSRKKQMRVIAAGGGIIDNRDAMRAVKKLNAVVVSLKIGAAVAWERINKSPSGLPPFLKTTANPRAAHRTLHNRRAAAYRHNAIVIMAKGKTPKQIAAEIKRKLNLS